MRESEEYRNKIISKEEWINSMVITNECLKNMSDWIFSKVNEEYSMSSDWDNRWRTGGTLEDVLEEAHLTKDYILDGIRRFVKDKDLRIKKIKEYIGI